MKPYTVYVDDNQRTPHYQQAVKVLGSLYTDHEGLTGRAYAEAVSGRHLAEFQKLWKEMRGPLCICKLRNRRCAGCTANRWFNGVVPPGNDHASMWQHRESGERVYIFQPYSIHNVKPLAAFCDEHKLKLSITTYPGWHFPGAVLHVVLAPEENQIGGCTREGL